MKMFKAMQRTSLLLLGFSPALFAITPFPHRDPVTLDLAAEPTSSLLLAIAGLALIGCGLYRRAR